MATSVKPIPDGMHGVIPALAYKDTAAAIEFYKRAFGAIELMRMNDPKSGNIVHAEVRIAGDVVMLADEAPGFNHTPEQLGGAAVNLFFYVEDVDAVFERSVKAGATALAPVKDQFYGVRSGRLLDPFGYVWVVGTRKEELSAEEMDRRFKSL